MSKTKRTKCGDAGACWRPYTDGGRVGHCLLWGVTTSATARCDIPLAHVARAEAQLQELTARLRAANAALLGTEVST